MASRERTTSIKCAEPDCTDHAHYTYRTQREYAEIHARQKDHPYECTRHRNRHEVLRPDNTERTQVLIATKVPNHRGDGYLPGLFWIPEGHNQGGSGFTFGPGYKAHADDFPEGTRLIVTARIEICDPPASTTEETNPHA